MISDGLFSADTIENGTVCLGIRAVYMAEVCDVYGVKAHDRMKESYEID